MGLICSADPSLERSNHKYDIQKLQAKAIERAEEIKLLDKAIKVAESKKWTSVMPSVAVGNNFVSKNADPRFNIGWDVAEVVGGGKIRQINLEVARLKFEKLDLERKLKREVLEKTLALERAEEMVLRLNQKNSLLARRMKLINTEYKRGERDLDSMFKYWEMDETIQSQVFEAMDQVTVHKSHLEDLVKGSLDEFGDVNKVKPKQF